MRTTGIDDGDEDILCGNTAGYIGFFENLGRSESGLPKWSAPSLLSIQSGRADGSVLSESWPDPSGSIQGPCEAKWGYTTLSVADWDGDRRPDILYNSIWSQIGLLRNDGKTLTEIPLRTEVTENPPPWYWWNSESNGALTQWRTTPVAVDFDADGKLDLVSLDQEGFLTLRSQGKSAKRLLSTKTTIRFGSTDRSCGGSGRIKIAVVDWDGDSRLDMLVNSENATWYRNCEDRDGNIVLKKVGNLARRNVAGHTSSPAVCDFDRMENRICWSVPRMVESITSPTTTASSIP